MLTIKTMTSMPIAIMAMTMSLMTTSTFAKGKNMPTRDGILKINGAELYYKTLGSGIPIVVLHGGPGMEHTCFLPHMEKLASKYQLIFYDQRSSGRSKSGTDDASITLDNFIEDLEGIRKAFKLEKMHILGHSWGATLALFYATRHPGNIKSLILINSAGARTMSFEKIMASVNAKRNPADEQLIKTLSESDAFKKGNVETMEKYWKLFLKPYFFNQSLAETLDTRLTETTIKNMPLINQKPLGQELSQFDIRKKLKLIKSPTLIVHGDSDPIPLQYAQEIHENIKDSKLLVLKDCGHYSFIEHPEKIFRIIANFI